MGFVSWQRYSTVVVSLRQTLRRWTEGETYVRQGDHHVGIGPHSSYKFIAQSDIQRTLTLKISQKQAQIHTRVQKHLLKPWWPMTKFFAPLFTQEFSTFCITNTVLQPLYRTTCISWHTPLKTGGFCCSKVLLPACPADDNVQIQIRDKTFEFSSTVLPALCPYYSVLSFIYFIEQASVKARPSCSELDHPVHFCTTNSVYAINYTKF